MGSCYVKTIIYFPAVKLKVRLRVFSYLKQCIHFISTRIKQPQLAMFCTACFACALSCLSRRSKPRNPILRRSRAVFCLMCFEVSGVSAGLNPGYSQVRQKYFVGQDTIVKHIVNLKTQLFHHFWSLKELTAGMLFSHPFS